MLLHHGYGGQIVRIEMVRPDDWHLHLRDGQYMADIVGYSTARFGRALIMPNLKPPITTVDEALDYHRRISMAVPEENCRFKPLLALYFTDNTSPEEIRRATESRFIKAVKYYPAGATTNSDAGVTDIKKTYRVLERMQELGMVLCVHGEVVDPSVDIFDREAVCIDTVLAPLLHDFPALKVVLEHVTTKEGVDFVTGAGKNVAGTFTAHHLLLNRNAIFAGGIQPHHYCLPVLKREAHRQALVAAAVSGNPKFFLGTDSAPHLRNMKEKACGCAGCFTAHAGIELYVEAFDAEGRIDRLEGFASFYGADFYGLSRNTSKVTLVREAWRVPKQLPFGDHVDGVVPLRAGETVQWKLLGV